MCLNSFDFALNFEGKGSNFCHLNVIKCCCSGNQYSKSTCFFQTFKKIVHWLRVHENKITIKVLLIVIIWKNDVKFNVKMTKNVF